MASEEDTSPPLPRLLTLPDELLEDIVYHLLPADALAFGATCRQCNKITYEPLVWRRHCLAGWRDWHEDHNFEERLRLPPAQTRWRDLYNERRRTDAKVAATFEQVLQEQQLRSHRIEEIAERGGDAVEMVTRILEETQDDAEDVLARRFYADVILSRMSRATALGKWRRLQKRQMIGLEEVLGAFDLFAVSEPRNSLSAIDQELERLADEIRQQTPEFEELSIRRRAILVAEFLRTKQLVGNPDATNYHALRNNYISLALFSPPHTSLPLQTAAIYSAVARKLGVNARPSNYPQHVHVVIEAPRDVSLDGRPLLPHADTEPETMHMDPWNTHEEIPVDRLRLRLLQLGATEDSVDQHLGAAGTTEIVYRTARNIMNSVQEARRLNPGEVRPELEAAWYSTLWAFTILSEQQHGNAGLQRRRHCLPYLIPHYQQHYPEDIGLIEKLLAPLFENEPEHPELMRHITATRAADRNKPPPSPRDSAAAKKVMFRIGQYFVHRRLQYEGIIIGWDAECTADQNWIQTMNVDSLPRGRTQPFYNVISDDKSMRYVAEENILVVPLSREPMPKLMKWAGRWFKRWDPETGRFVSNMRDEYPDD